MNIRLFITMLIAFAAPTLAQAADKSTTSAATERSAMLQTLGRGSAFTSNNQQYQLLSGVRAMQSLAKEQPPQTLSRAGGGKLIETKGSFVVFTAAQQGPASTALVDGETSYPTAVNQRTGGIGILPGTLNVKLKNMGSAAAVGASYGLELLREFAHLQVVFYRVKPGQDVVAAAAALAADSRVVSAEVEVIEHVPVPN